MKTVPYTLPECPALEKAKVAKRYADRARGLIGLETLPPNEGLLIERCNAIHTFFMKFAIDAYFLDASGKVVKTVKNVKPWTFFVWGGWKARKTLEVRSQTSEVNSSSSVAVSSQSWV